eukprot:COSAG04_NODE_27424_length_283_cov_0.842391_1_plen_61_part_01
MAAAGLEIVTTGTQTGLPQLFSRPFSQKKFRSSFPLRALSAVGLRSKPFVCVFLAVAAIVG